VNKICYLPLLWQHQVASQQSSSSDINIPYPQICLPPSHVSSWQVTTKNTKYYSYYSFSKFSILIGWLAVRKNPYPDRGPYFPYLERCPGCHLPGGKFLLCKQKNFCFLNFQLCVTDKNFKQLNFFWLSMHAYRILLPSETDDSRFNSREKHMLTDSVQPSVQFIDLACSVCTVKYQTSVFCMDLAPSSLGPY
jgi:hypothetical protein